METKQMFTCLWLLSSVILCLTSQCYDSSSTDSSFWFDKCFVKIVFEIMRKINQSLMIRKNPPHTRLWSALVDIFSSGATVLLFCTDSLDKNIYTKWEKDSPPAIKPHWRVLISCIHIGRWDWKLFSFLRVESTRPFDTEASTSKPSSPKERLSWTDGSRRVRS